MGDHGARSSLVTPPPEVSLVLTVVALAPVLLVLVLMTVLGWSAARAGLVTAAVTLVLALTVFG